jgi:hypothetical protein
MERLVLPFRILMSLTNFCFFLVSVNCIYTLLKPVKCEDASLQYLLGGMFLIMLLSLANLYYFTVGHSKKRSCFTKFLIILTIVSFGFNVVLSPFNFYSSADLHRFNYIIFFTSMSRGLSVFTFNYVFYRFIKNK